MPRFYLHGEWADCCILDSEGEELSTFEAARERAVKAATELAAEGMRAGSERVTERIIIQDDHGASLGTVVVEARVSVEACQPDGTFLAHPNLKSALQVKGVASNEAESGKFLR